MTGNAALGISLRGLWLAFTNVTLAILSGLFAYAHALNFLRYQRISNFLIVAKEFLDASFFVARRAPFRTSRHPCHWLVGVAGTFLPLLFRPVDRPCDLVLGQLLQLLGLILQVAGILSLNRSFGIVAADRGIKTDGLYRAVRHPLYSSYILGHIGYILNNPSLENCVIFVLGTMLQVHRMFIEESFLKHDDAYGEYMKRTRWRLIPFVF
ncbi:MAG: isoprenylcysteine carboxylmethyltransferase family protein [Acidobacteria bacterium]|nr:isoprenylcysteine carboxylmethyltransferase family protein [Acidobacteriota bacterium]